MLDMQRAESENALRGKDEEEEGERKKRQDIPAESSGELGKQIGICWNSAQFETLKTGLKYNQL